MNEQLDITDELVSPSGVRATIISEINRQISFKLSFHDLFPFSLTQDLMREKNSKRYSSLKSLLKFSKLFLNFKSSALDF